MRSTHINKDSLQFKLANFNTTLVKIILHMESEIKRLLMLKIKKTKNKKRNDNARLAAK